MANIPKLYKWQKQAYKNWSKNNYVGTVEAHTGVGKSILAYFSLKVLKPKKILIVVHTEHLQEQHKNNLLKYFPNLTEEYIGLVGGGHKEFNKRVTIAIVNSIRYDVLKNYEYDLVILDECHHYFSEINKTFLKQIKIKKILLLSATPTREDELHEPFLNKFPVVYRYTQDEAVKDKIVSEYEIKNVPVTLKREEEKKYKIYDNIVRQNWSNYGSINEIKRCMKERDYVAVKLMKAISKRRQLIQKSLNKVEECVEIIKDELVFNNGEIPKTIIFNEYIESADVIEAKLKKLNIPCCVYHSGLKKKERKKMLDEFRNGTVNIMVAVKALDEGVNVPEIQIAIIVAGSSSKRQQIQRIGRALRKKGDKTAKIYQIYVKSYSDINSKDEDWLRNRMKGLF